MKSFFKKAWAFDLFVALGVMLAAAAFYFTLIHPIKFSGAVGRESVPVYGEVDLIAGPELLWMKDKIPAGARRNLVYGQLDWEILEMKQIDLEGRPALLTRVKLRLMQAEGGGLWYQKALIRIGDTLTLTQPQYVVRGWIYEFHLLNENGTL